MKSKKSNQVKEDYRRVENQYPRRALGHFLKPWLLVSSQAAILQGPCSVPKELSSSHSHR